jgi:hypothetical protein
MKVVREVPLFLLFTALWLAGIEFAISKYLDSFPSTPQFSTTEYPKYYNRRDAVVRADAFGFGSTYELNRWGFRGPDVALKKKPGVKRVLMVGDSLFFGPTVAEDETIPALLQDKLNSLGGKWEVLNAGVGSYSVWDYEGYLKHFGLNFEPDYVVLGIYRNDFFNRTAYDIDQEYFKGPLLGPDLAKGKWTNRLMDLKLFRFLAAYLQRYMGPKVGMSKLMTPEEYREIKDIVGGDEQSAQAVKGWLEEWKYHPFIFYQDPYPFATALWKPVEEPLKGVRKLVGKNVVSVGFPLQWETVEGYRYPEPKAEVERIMKRVGIVYEDMRPFLDPEHFNMRYDYAHLGREGHEIVVERILNQFRRKGWL